MPGQRRQGVEDGGGGWGELGRKTREAVRADRERGNSDMTVTNCLVFIQMM